MADAKVPSLAPHTQFPLTPNLDTREIAPESSTLAHRGSLYVAIIQPSVHRWQRPWRHQRIIVLFAASPRDMKLRLRLEGRMQAGEQVLRVRRVGE